MTIDDLVSRFDEIGLKDFSSRVQMRIMLKVIAETLCELRLSHNRRILDAGDFRELLFTLAELLDTPKPTRTVLQEFCPGCGHVHAKPEICGVSMGGAGECACKAEVRV